MDLSHLNPPQREAVKTLEGPLLVLAGAGSGKTRVITHRIAHLLEKKVAPRSILSVTFTNKAAAEMKERVVHLAGQKALGVTLSTFHAFGAEVLKQHLHHLGWPKKFAILDMGDQISIVRRAMKERQVDDREFDARKVLALISRAKNAGVVPEPSPEEQDDDYDLVTHLVFPLYQLALKAQGAVDFDDLIILPSRLFTEIPELAAKYQERFRYLMVDEYQDTNASQLELLVHLAGSKHNVCAVGDDDQCIYSWRGAEVKNILEFEKHFPGAKEVRLEQNYRSTSVILDAANAVIAKNPVRRAKKMWSDKLGGPLIQVVVAPSEDEEARFVGIEIRKLLEAGAAPDDLAVLYRTNGQARPIEEALRERGIFYEVVGGQEFFDRREVKDVIAYFKVIANPKDEISLLRIVNVPPRGIGDVTLDRLSTHASKEGEGLMATLKRAAEFDDLPKGAAEKVSEFCDLIERYRAGFAKGNLARTTQALLDEIGFEAWARSGTTTAAAADRKMSGVKQVLQSLESYERREGPKAGLLTYLNRLTLDSKDDDEEGPRGGRVTLMTLHGAKGLEWNTVFLIGLEEDLLPHGGMQGEPQNLEEERRLAYVGITRARQRLVVSRAAMRVKRGREMQRTPSRFLEDLPPHLVEVIDLETPTGPVTVKEQSFFKDLRAKLESQGQGGAPSGAPGAISGPSTR